MVWSLNFNCCGCGQKSSSTIVNRFWHETIQKNLLLQIPKVIVLFSSCIKGTIHLYVLFAASRRFFKLLQIVVLNYSFNKSFFGLFLLFKDNSEKTWKFRKKWILSMTSSINDATCQLRLFPSQVVKKHGWWSLHSSHSNLKKSFWWRICFSFLKIQVFWTPLHTFWEDPIRLLDIPHSLKAQYILQALNLDSSCPMIFWIRKTYTGSSFSRN